MRAIICRSYGAPDDVLQLADIDEPAVADDEVLVQVHATSVNAADWHLVRAVPAMARLQIGLRKPGFGVPGCDAAGAWKPSARTSRRSVEVTRCSPPRSCTGSAPSPSGCRSPRTSSRASHPTSPFEQAAAVPLAASTALQGLRDHGHLELGQSVLIVGASGGVGTFAVQIAKSFGAEVTGVCSTRNTDMVRSLGADHVIDYTTTNFTDIGHRYDLILQAAGADSDNRWIGALTRILAGRLLSRFVSQTITSFTVRPNGQDLDFVGTLIEAGKVDPVIDRTYSLTDIHDAIRHVEKGHTRGKGRHHRRRRTARLTVGAGWQVPNPRREEALRRGPRTALLTGADDGIRTRDPHLGKASRPVWQVPLNAFPLVTGGAPVRRVPLFPPILPE